MERRIRMVRKQGSTDQCAKLLILGLLFLCCTSSESSSSMLLNGRFPQKFLFKQKGVQTAARNADSISYAYETRYFTQTLDHYSFRPESYETFQQRYLLSTKYWTGPQHDAPIFLYCGNEGDITWFAENTGFMWEIAPRFRAMLVFPEHRYYGKSIPDMAAANHTAETLAYLTSEQALADYVTLIFELKKNFSADSSPVVAFGGSYGGMLAAWLRLKYPHVVIGAVSSSAPVVQFDNISPSDSFYRIASQDFKTESASCFETIRSSWNALDVAAAQTGGLKALNDKFHFCSNVTPDLGSIEGFFYSAWSFLAMVDYPIPADFLMPLPAYPIREVCKAIDGMPEDSGILDRVFAGANVYYNSTGDVHCFDPTGDPHGMALWAWQACTEMVMGLTSNPNNSMFPPTLDLEQTISYCRSLYGISPRPHWIAQEFGGHDIRAVLRHFASNIVFWNGLLDPWSGGGVLQNISQTVVAIVAPEGAHHLDLRWSTKGDPAWLIEQRAEEERNIELWLTQYYADWNASHG